MTSPKQSRFPVRITRRAWRALASSLLLATAFPVLTPPALAAGQALVQSAPANAIITDLAQVEAALARGAIVWDVRSTGEYQRGHLPGAISIGDAGKVLRDEHREDFLATAVIEKLFSAAGLDPSQEILVYGGRGNPYAYFGSYALRYFGATRVSVFHDGFEGWRDAGKPVSSETTRRAPVALTLKVVPSLARSTEEVVQRFAQADVQILDVRTRKEFSGEDIRAIRGGHIPGAINIPFEENWQDPATAQKIARKEVTSSAGQSLKNRAELEALYQALDRDRETIVYCQSGVRAAETSTVLESLGFRNVKVYDSSWLGWAAKLSAPANNETFLNVGLLNGQILALKKQVDELENKLATK